MRIHQLSTHILQFGIAFVFIYAAIQIFLNPQGFVHYTPEIIFDFVSVNTFMYTFATLEILLSIWIISGKKMMYPSLITAGIMALVVLFNLDMFIVLFRNVAIMCGALALAGISHEEELAEHRKDSPVNQQSNPTFTQVSNPQIQTPAQPTPIQTNPNPMPSPPSFQPQTSTIPSPSR